MSDMHASLCGTVAANSEALRQARAHQERLERIAARAVAPAIEIRACEALLRMPATPFVATVTDGQIAEAHTILHQSEEIPPIGTILSIERIQREVCREYQVERSEMLSEKRHHAILRPRQVAVYLCKQLTQSTFPHIGRRFGGRDHSTAICSFRKISRLLETDLELRATVQHIAHNLGRQIAFGEAA